MKTEARLTFDRVRHDQDNTAHLVISLSAPALAAERTRPPILLVPVIDVSPSMRGDKLAYAQRSVLKVIDHLAPGDMCGLVQFSGHAEVLSVPVKITPQTKDELKRKVGALRIGNATNIADALLTGLKVANEMDLPADVVTRVILFTDGEANTGPAIRDADILTLLEKNIGLATVSAFGYGLDAKQSLLGEIAKRGKANYAFIENPDAALSAFGRELGGLLSTYAMDLVLQVQPLAGHDITGVISDVDAKEGATGELTIKIPDVLAEETRHIVLGVKLLKQKTGFPRPVNVFEMKFAYDIIGPGGSKERKVEELKVKAEFVKPGEEQAKPHEALDEIAGLAQIVRSQIEAEEKAKRGDYSGAALHMQKTADDFTRRGLTQHRLVASNLSAKMGNHAAYVSSEGYRVSMSNGGTRGVGVANYDAGAEHDLHLMGTVTTTSSTAGLAASFHDAPAIPIVQDPAVAPSVGIGIGGGFQIPLSGMGDPVGGDHNARAQAVMTRMWTIGDAQLQQPVAAPPAPAPLEVDKPKKSSKRKPITQTKSKRW